LQISFSYRAVVDCHEYRRIITASFAHVDIIHILFNMMSVFNLGGLEGVYGSLPFFTLSMELVVLTMLMHLIIIFILGKLLHRDR